MINQSIVVSNPTVGLRMRPYINRGPVSQHVWDVKEPSLLKAVGHKFVVLSKLRPKSIFFVSTSPTDPLKLVQSYQYYCLDYLITLGGGGGHSYYT
jgi:hypothetical protein